MKIKTCFLRNHWAVFNQILYYMVKTLKNLLLWNRRADFHETRNRGLLPIIVCSNDGWSDLDLFYGKAKFGKLGLSIGKNGKQWIYQKLLQPVA